MKSIRMFKRVTVFFLLVALGFMSSVLLPSREALSSSSQGLVFILDCSGSMWGRVDGTPKIVIAKAILQDLVQDVPPDTAMGLMAYGHRKKGQCSDIEMVAPLGSTPQEMSGVLQRLTARGMTPLSDSLVQAGALLTGRPGPATVVLISDGIETCDGDPCKTAGSIKEKGLEVVIHVVGFDVDENAAAQLACIAHAGGGRFFRADSVEELKTALGQVRESVVENKPLPEPPKAEALPETTSDSKRVRIPGPGTVVLKPAPWVPMPPYFWALVDAETGEERARGQEPSLRVKPGEYQILWNQSQHAHAPILLTESVRVESARTVEVPIHTGLRLTVPEGIGPPYEWGLIEPEEEKPFWECRETLDSVVVPSGVFRLFWRQVQHRTMPVLLKEVVVEQGQLNDVVLDSGLALQPANWANKTPHYYRIIDAEGNIRGSWQDLTPQLAPPGTYTLVYRQSQHNNNEVVWGPVTIPEQGFATVALHSGLQFIHDPTAKPPYRIILVNLQNNAEILAQETWDPLLVPPGRYRLDWWEKQHGSKRTTLADELTMEAGILLEVEM